MKNNKQQIICASLGVQPAVPLPNSKLGIALGTIGNEPINGLRHKEENGTCGWYIWCGEEKTNDADFFSPIHYEHISNYIPQVENYLALPPGYRFLIGNNNYEDIWFDSTLLKM